MALAPQRPFAALRECIDVVQALWRGETVTHAGEIQLHEARLSWTPGQLPLALAGRGPRVERFAAERADWILLAGRASHTVPDLVTRLRQTSQAARDRLPSIAWNPVAAWTDAMREDLRAHLAYMAVDMPEADRASLGLDGATTSKLRDLVNSRGPRAAATLITDSALEEYAIVGDRAAVVRRLSGLREQVRPELIVFDAGDYSITFLESVASLALDAGARSLHNLESLD
jgi:alkanesulfonate monooxygenase SsuD/methylene tetrahydromethanopterin reductase-like flavin-dependent oxidoreductase (luciferase family)